MMQLLLLLTFRLMTVDLTFFQFIDWFLDVLDEDLEDMKKEGLEADKDNEQQPETIAEEGIQEVQKIEKMDISNQEKITLLK